MVFVYFFQCFFVLQVVIVWGEFIIQYYFVFVQIKFQFEVDQNQISIIEQFFQYVVCFVGQFFYMCQVFFVYLVKGFVVRFVDYRIVYGVVFQEQIEQWWVQFNIFFDFKMFYQRVSSMVMYDIFNRYYIQFFYQIFGIGEQMFYLSRDICFSQFVYNEVVEFVVYYIFAIKLFNVCVIFC